MKNRYKNRIGRGALRFQVQTAEILKLQDLKAGPVRGLLSKEGKEGHRP